MAAPLERKECFGEDCIDVLDPQPLEVIAPEVEAKKRKSAPGVRVVGRRIYDPENGKTCHQCRQKTTDFAAACKQVKKKGPCPIKYCHKCLLNRYGENAEEATRNKDWICPKCRGICNCSFCRKKKGEMPTGIMAHIAKASGCTSVHDLLEKGSDVVAAAQAILKVNGNDKDLKRARGTDADKVATERDENVDIDLNTVPSDEGDENIGVDLNALPSVRIKQRQKLQHNLKKNHADERSHGGGNGDPLLSDESPDSLNSNIVLPRGTPVVNIAGAKLDDEDIGAAIQFLEFCRAFAEIFQIRKGQPERILQDVVGGRELRLVSSVVAEFHINLLSVIQEGKGKKPLAYTRDGDAWVIDVGKYMSESAYISKELPLNYLYQGISGYKILNPSCKLRVLNFLCDETLSTDKLRNWIDNQNGIAAEPMNAARGKARAAKEKEKKLKERLKLNMDTTVLSPNEAAAVSDEENKDIISQIKEAQEVKRAAINDMATIDKGGGLWTKPLMVEKGIAYWKLDGYCDNTTMLLQEYGDDELMANKDKWFIFTEDEEKAIEEHVATR
ncbi:hypothetical protein U9M48_024186 [Paspalum notatum var. saurae]|uniref:DDT domain-containing protein n=1 Tax=Paspalum notatum var. saurae TaxID=547442 RepID=A0AAQ3WWT1_PASNO